MELDIAAVTRALAQDEHGIWRSQESAALSYPEGAHSVFFQVEAQSYWFRHRNACLAALMHHFPPAGTLLDVGGGNGFVCRGLLDAGFDSALLEPGPAGAANAKASGVPRVLCATLEGAGFQDGCVPSAGLFDVIEHMEDDLELLRQVHRVLVPRGRLFVTVPAEPWLWSDDDNHAGHFRRYRGRTLRERLEACGFELEYEGHLFAPLVAPLFLLKSLPSRLGVRSKNADVEAVQRDHSSEGLAGRAVEWLLSLEYKRVSRARALPFGTSCIAIATRSEASR